MRFKWIISIILILILATTLSKGLSNTFEDITKNDNISENNDGYGVSNLDSISLDQTISIPRISDSKVVIDGIISQNEYGTSFEHNLRSILINWEHNAENLAIGIVAPSTGWVAWGAGANMSYTNIIMGGITGSSVYCLDMNGVGYTIPDNDTDSGGTDDIIECESTEDLDSTTLEFIIPLNSGDILDPGMDIGTVIEMFFAFSISGSDNLLSDHGGPAGRTELISVQLDPLEFVPKPEIGDFDRSIPLVEDSSVVLDGEIGMFEYGRSFTDPLTGIEVHWEHNEIDFTVGLVSPGTGWVSLGIGPNMADSSMYMGGLENGATYCYDLNGLDDWLHEEDLNDNGENDILECVASENGGQTMLEFKLPLNTSDELDSDMESLGIYDMFLGYQASIDTITEIHTGHSDVFKVLVMPEADNYETFIDLESEVEADFNQTLYFEIELTNVNGTLLANIPVLFYRQTQFGIVIFDSKITNSEGKANASYTNPHLLYDHTFGAKSLEFVNVTQDGNLYTYLSSGNEQVINFNEKIEHDQRAENIRLTRIGLLVAFWVVGIIIWGGFGYTFYQMYQIFKGRNEEIVENVAPEGDENLNGGNPE
ncbi:MAG: hypothetical protein GPJ54_11630 [Candidatus Heimdallarchaeota archaeon]|nr:hypothetical protein [Candidatus Heimdallarchaeota archaeon]